MAAGAAAASAAARAGAIRRFMGLSPSWTREHVVGQVQLALQDLSGGAHERGALHAGVCAETLDSHLDVDAALRDAAPTMRARLARAAPLAITVPGSANAVATPIAPVTACDAWQRRGVK